MEEVKDNQGRVYLRVDVQSGETGSTVVWEFVTGDTVTSHQEKMYDDPAAAQQHAAALVKSHRDWMDRRRAHGLDKGNDKPSEAP